MFRTDATIASSCRACGSRIEVGTAGNGKSLITTEAMVGDRPEPKGAPGMPPGGMGGMDY
jgi:hypothetical protein